MSTVTAREPQNLLHGRPPLGRRIAPRRKLAVPINVTILRSGVPDAVPGRSVDVGVGGLGAILAAEVFPGELVGIEFRLPDSGPVLAKARVCYQKRLHCGLQFLAISSEQQKMLGAFTLQDSRKITDPRNEAAAPAMSSKSGQNPTPLPKFLSGPPRVSSPSSSRYLRRKVIMLLAASVIVVAGVGWWQWEQSWRELESRLQDPSVEVSQAAISVPPDVMQRLLVHKVDPVVPRGSKVRGVVVLSAVIGRDGSVTSLRPISGPDTLTQAAMDSVQWWKYEPYRQNGAPVDVQTTLAVEFR